LISSLTSFRFILAFVVFLFHCNMHLNWRIGIKIIDKFFENGATFMTGFFVLSGFIMTHVYKNIDLSKKEGIFIYYIKRFARIYPAYLVGTVVYFSIFRDFNLKEFIRIFLNDIFLIQAYFPSMFGLGINGATWSLSVEMFLYFIFPLLMIIFNKKGKILLLLAIIGTSLLSINSILYSGDNIYSNPIFRVPDFLCGIGFYFFLSKKYFNGYTHSLVLLLLCCSCILLGGGKNQYVMGQFIISPLFGAWICCVFYSQNKFYNNKIITYLGKISYSFYIWQFSAIILGKYLIKTNDRIDSNLIMAASLLINILCAATSNFLIEEPLRKLIIRKATPKTLLFPNI